MNDTDQTAALRAAPGAQRKTALVAGIFYLLTLCLDPDPRPL